MDMIADPPAILEGLVPDNDASKPPAGARQCSAGFIRPLSAPEN
jgi:hypothetical protein